MALKRAASSSTKPNSTSVQVNEILKDKKIALNIDYKIERPSSQSWLVLGQPLKKNFLQLFSPFIPYVKDRCLLITLNPTSNIIVVNMSKTQIGYGTKPKKTTQLGLIAWPLQRENSSDQLGSKTPSCLAAKP